MQRPRERLDPVHQHGPGLHDVARRVVATSGTARVRATPRTVQGPVSPPRGAAPPAVRRRRAVHALPRCRGMVSARAAMSSGTQCPESRRVGPLQHQHAAAAARHRAFDGVQPRRKAATSSSAACVAPLPPHCRRRPARRRGWRIERRDRGVGADGGRRGDRPRAGHTRQVLGQYEIRSTAASAARSARRGARRGRSGRAPGRRSPRPETGRDRGVDRHPGPRPGFGGAPKVTAARWWPTPARGRSPWRRARRSARSIVWPIR